MELIYDCARSPHKYDDNSYPYDFGKFKMLFGIEVVRTMMSKYDILTKHIPIIQTDSIGKWIVDKENDIF